LPWTQVSFQPKFGVVRGFNAQFSTMHASMKFIGAHPPIFPARFDLFQSFIGLFTVFTSIQTKHLRSIVWHDR
jgi:hypothetical protein